MENYIDNFTNKTQVLIKLMIAKKNLKCIDQTLNKSNNPKVKKAMEMIDEVIEELVIERNNRLEKK